MRADTCMRIVDCDRKRSTGRLAGGLLTDPKPANLHLAPFKFMIDAGTPYARFQASDSRKSRVSAAASSPRTRTASRLAEIISSNGRSS